MGDQRGLCEYCDRLRQTLQRFGLYTSIWQREIFVEKLKEFMEIEGAPEKIAKVAEFLGHPNDGILRLWSESKNLPDWPIMLMIFEHIEQRFCPESEDD